MNVSQSRLNLSNSTKKLPVKKGYVISEVSGDWGSSLRSSVPALSGSSLNSSSVSVKIPDAGPIANMSSRKK